jgi:hypothetical protein
MLIILSLMLGSELIELDVVLDDLPLEVIELGSDV